MTDLFFPRVAVIGIGLIGGSFVLGLRQAGCVGTVVCADADRKSIGKAIELEIVDGGSRSNAEAVRDADLVVLSTPVGVMGAVMAEIAPHLKAGCIVTDVGSVKGSVLSSVEPFLPAGVHFVAGHPIAGTEDSGPEAAFAELFQGRACILTPAETTNADALDKIRRAWEACGARVVVLSSDKHDRILALVSHLPHVVAFSIMGTADDLGGEIEEKVFSFAGSSFRDFTRVAASDPVMWRDIFLNNRDAVLDVLSRLKKDVAKLEKAITDGKGEDIEAILHRGRALRRQF